ncbi:MULTISPECIES: PhzF family phenazine biosynthesis protein [Aerococcus]|uniref:PhzF family phenazine biosynthesis protein n=1 Tax=Aerococcus TaxID=1375 RepID=UPI003B221600
MSRSFAPKLAIDEDPVCGSGHCHIAPLWSKNFGKKGILVRQASARGGTLRCSVTEDLVTLAGAAVLYAVSELNIPG